MLKYMLDTDICIYTIKRKPPQLKRLFKIHIGPFDTMIAGHARSIGLTLVTNNLREFERVNGLRVCNWLT